MKKIIVLLLVAISVMCIAGEIVYVTPKGKSIILLDPAKLLLEVKK